MITKKEIIERYNECILAQEDEKVLGVNNYRCNTECNHVTKTIDVDSGVTPFLISCEKCKADATSSFYDDLVPDQAPTFEWYRPSLDQVLAIRNESLSLPPASKGHNESILEHILDGGLLSRSVGGFYSLKPGDNITVEGKTATVSHLIGVERIKKGTSLTTVVCYDTSGGRIDLTSIMPFTLDVNMKSIGKVYASGTTYIMCTGPGKSPRTFSGVVIRQDDPTSDHYKGSYSNTWSSVPFFETTLIVEVSNAGWKPFVKLGESPG